MAGMDPAPDDYICKRNESQVKHLWHHDHGSSCVTDMAFLCDRSLLYITPPAEPEVHVKTLRLLDAKGKPRVLPISVALTSPQSVSSNNDGRTLVILDRINGDENRILVFEKERSGAAWSPRHTIDVVIMQWLAKASAICSGKISCTTYVDNLVVNLDANGTKCWYYRLADEEPNIEDKYIDVDDRGNIAVSFPRKEKPQRNGGAFLIDSSGSLINRFPPELAIDPRGMCFTARGHILMADWGSEGVFLFRTDWVFIRQVLKLSKEPHGLALLSDKYFSIAYEDGISVYSI